MLDVLLVTDIKFWQCAYGSQQRIYRIVRHLTEKGFRVGVQFVRRCTPPDSLPSLPAVKIFKPPMAAQGIRTRRQKLKSGVGRFCRAIPFIGKYFQPTVNFLRQTLRNCLYDGRKPSAGTQATGKSIHDFASEPDAVAVCQTIIRESPKIVLLEYIRTTFLIEHIRKTAKPIPLIMLDTIDVQSERTENFKQMGIVHWVDIDAQTELRIADEADVVIAIQNEDAAFFKKGLRKSKVITVPHCHEISAADTPDTNHRIILFVGAKNKPNTFGISNFITTAWPNIRAQFGQKVKLRIVGSVCENLVAYADEPGIELAGFVDRLRDEYGRAHVIIAPIEFGGGLKIKVVEALCHGKALVATECAAQGLKDGIGSAFRVASSPEAMADEIVNILQNNELRRDLQKGALRFAETHFSEDVCFKEFDQMLKNAM